MLQFLRYFSYRTILTGGRLYYYEGNENTPHSHGRDTEIWKGRSTKHAADVAHGKHSQEMKFCSSLDGMSSFIICTKKKSL
jgi:hypothetical protein